MFRTPSPGDSRSVPLRKLLQGDRGEVRLCTSLQQREQKSQLQRSGIKLKNLAFYVWGDASLWAHWLQSFHMQLSYLGQSSFIVHLGSCILPGPQRSLWGLVASAGSQLWEPSFTFGGQKSLMTVTFLVSWHGRRYFHFRQVTHKNCIAPIIQPWMEKCFFLYNMN